MTTELNKLIFEQFLEIVFCSKGWCTKPDPCSFDYRVREEDQHKLMNVLYVCEDACGRRREVETSIDITDICVEDLTTCEWVEYLTPIAQAFVHNICPKHYRIIKTQTPCRQPPARFQPPHAKTTTIVQCPKPVVPCPPKEVVVYEVPECVNRCDCAHHETPVHTVIVRRDGCGCSH